MEMEKKPKKEIAPKHETPERFKEQARRLLKDHFYSLDFKTMESIALYIEEGCHRAESRVNLTKKFTRASFKLCEVLEILSLSGHILLNHIDNIVTSYNIYNVIW